MLIANALISAVFMAATGLFTAATPHAVIFAVLLAGGFFRSLEFTAVNALAYADIQPAQMSRATSFASVTQQVSFSLGVAIGADPASRTSLAWRDAYFAGRFRDCLLDCRAPSARSRRSRFCGCRKGRAGSWRACPRAPPPAGMSAPQIRGRRRRVTIMRAVNIRRLAPGASGGDGAQ